MARSKVRDELSRRLREHIAIAEAHPPEECPLTVRSVAAALRVSPTTLYKYGLNREINNAERRQRENRSFSGAVIERRFYTDRIRDLTEELANERRRSKNLVMQIAMLEANAARLGFDPEEMYRALLMPVRTISRAGNGRRWHDKPLFR